MIADFFAEGYTLAIFEGQGVKEEYMGYGYISRVPLSKEKAKIVQVTFKDNKTFTVPVSRLQIARAPKKEIEDVSAESN